MSEAQHPTAREARLATATKTGIVVPVYLPDPPPGDRTAGVDRDLQLALLRDNVEACLCVVESPSRICLTVDGPTAGVEPVEALGAELGVTTAVGERNLGKLGALRRGVQQLGLDGLDWLAVIDADGDHFANELVNLTRAALAARRRFGADEVLVIGSRHTRHRPMGWLRGELEELADRVLLDALAYAAARSGTPLRLEGVTTVEEFPDFHSGFKLFSPGAAGAVFLDPPQLCDVAEDAYFRHGCESVMTVEAVLAGAQLVSVFRTTFNEQPVSTFGQLKRDRLVADKMVWPCRRLDVPATFVDQWLRNHVPRLLLSTLAPEGKQELVDICNLVAEAFDLPPFSSGLTAGPSFI